MMISIVDSRMMKRGGLQRGKMWKTTKNLILTEPGERFGQAAELIGNDE